MCGSNAGDIRCEEFRNLVHESDQSDEHLKDSTCLTMFPETSSCSRFIGIDCDFDGCGCNKA